ncbi:uncharacterized protein LOC121388155 isoform X2 [Gigantopelta aegis]|uniref:uncharacterized protein LOC121388155 isoform X2 n=1 Tax=Gigantopelta aegis TaxID=1735272 RepID=UPI001B887CB2|nr:uncharacterized protein LOC121388155 isoform X2 [Gigantopelta aegis]
MTYQTCTSMDKFSLSSRSLTLGEPLVIYRCSKFRPPTENRPRIVRRKLGVNRETSVVCSETEKSRLLQANVVCLETEKTRLLQTSAVYPETEKGRLLQTRECDKEVTSSAPVLPDAAKPNFSKLDLTTLRMLGWAHGQPPKQPDNETTDREALNRITKKLYSRCNNSNSSGGDSVYQDYHNQLTASLQAFQNKQWPPLTRNELGPTVMRCRPVSGRLDRRPSPPCGTTLSAAQRPISLSLNTLRPSTAQSFRKSETPEVNQGNFDTLNPAVLADLIGSNSSRLSFGDSSGYKVDRSRDDDSTSRTESSSDSEDDDSSTSEPEEELFSGITPMPEVHLRPERLDSIYVPENKKDPRRFDFDAENYDIPPYDFGHPIPEPYNKLDLKLIAKQNYEWRDIIKTKPKEEYIERYLDRIVEIEKNQLETEEWESRRLKQLQIRRPRNLSARPRDRRCCSTCLQPACIGDCPDKFVSTNVCTLCRQPLCEGSCLETTYEDRSRHDREDEEEIKTYLKPSRRICQCCQTKHNAKLINANNLILGRPKSSNSTYSRGQGSTRPKDLRPCSVNDINAEVLKDFEKLGIEPSRPPPAKPNRPRSRSLLIPGKSYSSNRKDSITDQERLRKRKSKSAKLKRPKSVSVLC